MMQPVYQKPRLQERSFPIDELPDELLENILDHCDYTSLLNFSSTSWKNRKFVWYNHHHLTRLLNNKLLRMALKDCEDFLDPTTPVWHIIRSYARTDVEKAIALLDQIRDQKAKVTSRLEITRFLKPVQAKQLLLKAHEIIEGHVRIDEFRERIVRQLASIDLEEATRISELIEDPTRRLGAANSLVFFSRDANYLSYDEFRYFISPFLKVREPSEFRNSFPIRNVKVIRSCARFEPEWFIRMALTTLEGSQKVYVLYHIALELFRTHTEHVKELMDLAFKEASTFADLIYVAHAISQWDENRGKKVFEQALKMKPNFNDLPIEDYHPLPDLCNRYFDVATQSTLFKDYQLNSAILLCLVGSRRKDVQLYLQGVDLLMKFANDSLTYHYLPPNELCSFGTENAINIAHLFKNPRYRSAKLFQLAQFVIKEDPEQAICLVKEGIEFVKKLKNSPHEVSPYCAFLGDIF